jgi:hypothetical protein
LAAKRGLGTLDSEWAHLYEDVYEEMVTFEFNPNVHGELPALKFLSQQGFDFSDPGQRAWLEDYVREEGFRYVFLDPLYMRRLDQDHGRRPRASAVPHMAYGPERIDRRGANPHAPPLR